MQISDLAWVPVITILAYIPFLCYTDFRYREIPHGYWLGLATINIPVVALLYIIGGFPLELLVLSIGFIILYFTGMKLGLYGGADFIFLALISLVFIVNPLSGRVLMPLVVFEFLIACIAATGIIMMGIKRYDTITGEQLKFPMVILISAAFIFAVVLG